MTSVSVYIRMEEGRGEDEEEERRKKDALVTAYTLFFLRTFTLDTMCTSAFVLYSQMYSWHLLMWGEDMQLVASIHLTMVI